MTPWWTPKGRLLEFRSADRCKMHFFNYFFLELQSFIGSFEQKLTRKTYDFPLCATKEQEE